MWWGYRRGRFASFFWQLPQCVPVSSIQAALLYSSKKCPYPFHSGQQKSWEEGWRFQKEVICKGLGVASEGLLFQGFWVRLLSKCQQLLTWKKGKGGVGQAPHGVEIWGGGGGSRTGGGMDISRNYTLCLACWCSKMIIFCRTNLILWLQWPTKITFCIYYV